MKSIIFILLFTTINGYSQNQIEKVSNITQESEDPCTDIEIETDKFTGKITYSSPFIDDNISFVKTKEKGITRQYVSISIYDSYFSGVNNYGLVVLFKSGKKLIRSKEKIDVDVSTDANWRYSAFFVPTANEILLLKNEIIIGVKLYIFNSDVVEGETIRNYAKCILYTPKKIPSTKK